MGTHTICNMSKFSSFLIFFIAIITLSNNAQFSHCQLLSDAINSLIENTDVTAEDVEALTDKAVEQANKAESEEIQQLQQETQTEKIKDNNSTKSTTNQPTKSPTVSPSYFPTISPTAIPQTYAEIVIGNIFNLIGGGN